MALVRRGLARSRTQAERLVREGRVQLAGVPVTKTSRKVEPDAALTVEAGEHPDYVGRGALKLAGVLDELAQLGAAPVVAGRRCLDAGASTGGFTEVLLQRGADEVVAVDVGHDQLDASLRAHPRVRELSGTSVRGLQPADRRRPRSTWSSATCRSSRCSWCSPTWPRSCVPVADLLLLVKPQFEVGKGRLGSGGVVRDPQLRADALVGRGPRRPGAGPGGARAAPEPVAGAERQRRVLRVVQCRRTTSTASAGAAGPPAEARRRRPAGRCPARRRGGTRVNRRVLLVTHTGRPEALAAASEISEALMAAGIAVAVLPQEADELHELLGPHGLQRQLGDVEIADPERPGGGLRAGDRAGR